MTPKGIAIILVLAFTLAVVVLTSTTLVFIRSHRLFSHHQINRIQASYAAQAGINYALEMLRTGVWVPGTDCTVAAGACSVPFDLDPAGGCDFKPLSISGVSVLIWEPYDPSAPVNCLSLTNLTCIKATATYN